MEEVTIDWHGPFNLNDPNPTAHYGYVGLYLILHGSDIVYAGKTEKRGAVNEARRNIGKCMRHMTDIGLEWDQDKAKVYAGYFTKEHDRGKIDVTKTRLIRFLHSRPRSQLINKSKPHWSRSEEQFRILNEGNVPPSLPNEISSQH